MLVLMMVELIIDFSDTVTAGVLPWTLIRALILRLRIYFYLLHPCSAVLDSGVFQVDTAFLNVLSDHYNDFVSSI